MDIEQKVKQKPRRATYQDVLDAPSHKVAEVVHGRLYTHPRPAPLHAVIGSCLGMIIGPPFSLGVGGPGGWWIIDEPEIHFDDDILVPDVAGWRRERMPALPDTAFFTLAPDWVCEVLSPSTRKLDLGHKRDIYAREGVAYLWIIDPEDHTLDTFVLDKGHWVSTGALSGDMPVSLPPFEAISFLLSELWD